ncbi:MAG: hypothetical protein N3G21_03640 [Candidatus Hydrogenedentes bacterium]|nr:hypothetical protein [Candidatus Hydrogenedentota bacterium]
MVTFFIITVILYFSSYSFAETTPNTSTINTIPLSSYEETLIKNTLERINQLKSTHSLGNLPSTKSPPFDFNEYIIIPEEKYKTPLSTELPEFRKKTILTQENNEVITFEDIFHANSLELRIDICKALLQKDSKTTVEKIIHYLAHGSPNESLIVDEILPNIKPDIEKLLIELFQNSKIPTQKRMAIAYALGRIKSSESAWYLFNEANTTTIYEMKYTCLQSLSNIPHSLSLEQWAEFLQGNSLNISIIACKAIFDYGGIESEQYIRKLLLGEIQTPKKVREYALSRITDYPLSILVPLLIEIMKKNSEIALDSANILKNKTGMNFGPTPQLWEKWWSELTTAPDHTETNKPEEISPQPSDAIIHTPRTRRKG